MNKAQKKMFYLLIASSVIMFLSIFTFSYKILGVGLLQWVVVIVLAFRTTMLKQFSFDGFSGYNDKVMRESLKEKKYFKSAVYGLVSPLMIVGCLMVCTIITCMIFVF